MRATADDDAAAAADDDDDATVADWAVAAMVAAGWLGMASAAARVVDWGAAGSVEGAMAAEEAEAGCVAVGGGEGGGGGAGGEGGSLMKWGEKAASEGASAALEGRTEVTPAQQPIHCTRSHAREQQGRAHARH